MGAPKTKSRPATAARKELAKTLLQALTHELQSVIPLQTPAWIGCLVGSRITVLRDLGSGQCMVLAGVDADRAMSFLDAGVDTLFCAPSDWLEAWVDACGRDHSDRLGKEAAKLLSWSSADAASMATRLAQMPIAGEASRQVAESLLLEAADAELARRVHAPPAGGEGRLTFVNLQLALQRGPLLRRAAHEHPAWLVLVAQRLRLGRISPYRDPMQQLKAQAREDGMSHAAWAQLMATGPLRLPATNPSATAPDLVAAPMPDDEDAEWAHVVAAGKARHWVGDYWLALHPVFRDRVVRFTARFSPDCEWVEFLLHALGGELEMHAEEFESAAAIENEFGQIAAALQTYEELSADQTLDEDEHFQAMRQNNLPEPPRQRGWARWQRWHSAMEHYLERPFWVPIAHLEHGAFCADALATRFALNEESSTMGHCIAQYANRCEAGEYAAYRIRTHASHSLATLGVMILGLRDDAGAVATRADLDEVSGPDNGEVSDAVRDFATWVVVQINLKLPAPIVPPGCDPDEDIDDLPW